MPPQRTSIAPEPQTVVFSREATPTQDFGAGFQKFWMVLFGCVCCLCILVTMAGSLFFAISLTADLRSALFAGLLSMGLDVCKASLPLLIHTLRKKETVLTTMAWAMFWSCFVWSVVCGIGWVFMLSDQSAARSLEEAGRAATSGLAMLALMIIAQVASAFGPVLVVNGMRHAKDLPDEEPPSPTPAQVDFGVLEPAGDGMSEWLREVIGVEPGARVHMAPAYDHYIAFCKMRGSAPMKQVEFRRILRLHGKALTGLDAGRDSSTYVPGISMAGASPPPRLLTAN
jgi:hypothetical protein